MDRKISRFSLLIILSLISGTVLGAGAIVFDATNAPKLTSMLTEAKKTYQELKMVSDKMDSLNGRLGGLLPNSGTDSLSRLNSSAHEWGSYLDFYSSPESFNLSLLSKSGYRNFGVGSGDKLPEIHQFLSNKLFPSKSEMVSFEKIEEIKKFRNDSVEHSSINGLAMAGEKKHSIRKIQRKIVELGAQAVRSPTIHDDLVITNKLLTIIASEMVQQRELVSQQLELISAVVAQGAPMVSSQRRH